MRAVSEIREHAPRYTLAEDYYRGTVGELFTSPAVKRALRNATHGFDVNLARRAVDARLDRIKITAVTVPDQEESTHALLDQVWTPNRMDRYSKQIHWAALTYGDAYLIAWPGDEDGTVDLFYNSPITTRMFYDDENPHLKSFAAKLWCVGQGDQESTRLNLYYADRIERYVTAHGNPGAEDADFTEYTDDEAVAWPIPNPFGEIPVFHYRTSEPYGYPEHEGAYGPQNAITKLSATQMATVDFAAFPQRYALLDATDQMIDWDDDPWEENAQGDGINPGRRRSTLKSEPGSLWQLPGASKVGQFDPASMDAFIEPIGLYTRLMASATATPLRFFDPVGQIPSGEALRADEAPLAASILDIEDWFEETWSEALEFSARLANINAPTVELRWAPVQVVDDQQGWQTILTKQQAGVPTFQSLVEAGYASDVVEEWQGDSEETSLESRVDVLNKIGTAVQSLSTGVTAGVIDESTVTAIIKVTLGELLPNVTVVQGTPATAAPVANELPPGSPNQPQLPFPTNGDSNNSNENSNDA
jgi:hypothetical protein